MKTRIEFSLTEAKYLFASAHDLQGSLLNVIGNVQFIQFAHLKDLQKLLLKLQHKLIHAKKKFVMVLMPGEIVSLNYFADQLIRCEASEFIRIILDKIFQAATDQLNHSIRFLNGLQS